MTVTHVYSYKVGHYRSEPDSMESKLEMEAFCFLLVDLRRDLLGDSTVLLARRLSLEEDLPRVCLEPSPLGAVLARSSIKAAKPASTAAT